MKTLLGQTGSPEPQSTYPSAFSYFGIYPVSLWKPAFFVPKLVNPI